MLIKNALYEIEKQNHDGKFIRVEAIKNNDFIKVMVTDSGKGIGPETVSQIFNPFYTTKPMGEGSGIGLDLCKKIIERHDGKIYVNHQIKNTQFVIELPILKS